MWGPIKTLNTSQALLSLVTLLQAFRAKHMTTRSLYIATIWMTMMEHHAFPVGQQNLILNISRVTNCYFTAQTHMQGRSSQKVAQEKTQIHQIPFLWRCKQQPVLWRVQHFLKRQNIKLLDRKIMKSVHQTTCLTLIQLWCQFCSCKELCQ